MACTDSKSPFGCRSKTRPQSHPPASVRAGGNAHSFIARHGGAGRLLAIAQGGIKNNQTFAAHTNPWLVGHRVTTIRSLVATKLRDGLKFTRPLPPVRLERCKPERIACIDAETILASVPTPYTVWSSFDAQLPHRPWPAHWPLPNGMLLNNPARAKRCPKPSESACTKASIAPLPLPCNGTALAPATASCLASST